jgi:beta-glucosidase
LTTWRNGDALVQAAAAQNNNTIVVVHSVGPLIIEPWIDHPNVTAVRVLRFFPFHALTISQVLWAGVPGQEVGNSLVDVLYGDWNPSGRLPYTIAKRIEDYGAQVIPGNGISEVISVPYADRLQIDYRHFDAVSLLCSSIKPF